MQIKYYTKHGSVYIHQMPPVGGIWFKQDRSGLVRPLAGAIHLPRRRLQDLLAEYPRSAVDSTVCFGSGVAGEFFEDAKREHMAEMPDGIETTIFFLIQKANDKFTLGYSSPVQRVEQCGMTEAELKLQI